VLHLIEHVHEAPVLVLAHVLDEGGLPPAVLPAPEQVLSWDRLA
jgi:hypothetical protein